VADVVDRTLAGIPDHVHTSWHFCLGNAWGNKMGGMTDGGYERILHRYYETNVGQFVLDFACREMSDASLLAGLPADKSVAVGVIDVRTLEIEAPEQVAERLRKVLKYVPADRVWATTDCGMKQLPRGCAQMKMRSLVEGTHMVRRELEG
jgi:5-methyltetrahydropteroyltriglutamate--homocysteine methyltransferase